MDIKPIETFYGGYRFRSRLEARWAVFFDAMGIKYQYEPEGFELGDGYRYLPDFYLPHEDVWVEIKGKPLTDKEREKIERFCIAKCDLANGGSKFRLLEGEIPQEPIEVAEGIAAIPAFSYISPDEFVRAIKEMTGKEGERPEAGVLLLSMWVHGKKEWNYLNLKKALLKARQARFEYGETPDHDTVEFGNTALRDMTSDFKAWKKNKGIE